MHLQGFELIINPGTLPVELGMLYFQTFISLLFYCIVICILFIFLDLKLHLQSTDYGNFLANEPSPLTVSVIDDKLKEKLVVEFQHLRNQCVEPLSTFLDYIT